MWFDSLVDWLTVSVLLQTIRFKTIENQHHSALDSLLKTWRAIIQMVSYFHRETSS